MDIFDLIKLDHTRILDLLDRVVDSGNRQGPGQDRMEAFHDFERELILHNRAEETVFYDSLKQDSKNKPWVEGRDEEHKRIEDMVQDLEDIDELSPTWHDELAIIAQNLRMHMEEEEEDLFTRVEPHISEAKRRQLGLRFERLKAQLSLDLNRQTGQPSEINPAGLGSEFQF